MTSEEVVLALEPWLARQRRPAWKPVVADGEGLSTDSKFCGLPWIGPDAPWPECGACKRPMTLFLQLDLDYLPEELENRFGTGLLQLFYCTDDDCQGNGGWEPFDGLNLARVVHPTRPGEIVLSTDSAPQFPSKGIIGWTRFEDLPDPGEHDENGLKRTYNFDSSTLQLECPELDINVTSPMDDCQVEEIANSKAGDKLAGWPAWVQGPEYPSCPKCSCRMVLLFQVDSEDHVPFMFGDCGTGHITQCPDHKDIVAFGWACS